MVLSCFLKPRGLLRLLTLAVVVAFLGTPRMVRGADAVEACIENHSQGQIKRDEGRLLEARQRFQACGVESCPGPIRTECNEFLTETASLIPSVTLAAQDASGIDLPHVRVEMNGEVLTGAFDGRSIDLDPGPHTFHFIHPDGRTVEETVIIREGEKARPITARFVEPSAGDLEERHRGSARRGVGVALGALGLSALASFTIFAIVGRAEQNELESRCAPDCTREEASRVRRSYAIADISLAVGAIALGSGTALYLTAPSPPRKGASGLVLGVRGAF